MRDILVFTACATAIVLSTYAIWTALRAELWAKEVMRAAAEAEKAASIATQILAALSEHAVPASNGRNGHEAPT